MYCKYVYTTDTRTSILNDIVALLTGETNVNNLSSVCDKTQSVINTTIPASWSVYDASAGTYAKCIRAINHDNTTYKYVTIDTSLETSSPIRLQFNSYYSWDNSAHTGTYKVIPYYRSYYGDRIALSSTGGCIILIATERMIMVWDTTLFYVSMILERKPYIQDNMPIQCVLSTYPADTGYYNLYFPWVTNTDNLRSYGDQAFIYAIESINMGKVPETTLTNLKYSLEPIRAYRSYFGTALYGSLSTVNDIWLVHKDVAVFTTFTYSSKKYLVLPMGTDSYSYNKLVVRIE